MKILITGSAGFIGYHLARQLGNRCDIVNVDCISPYYDIELKYARLKNLGFERCKIFDNNLVTSAVFPRQKFIKLDITNFSNLREVFRREEFTHVIHLAAQAGVRYSLESPASYIEANISGFLNVLECCRYFPVSHLLYASTSSVYGLNQAMPFSATMHADHPVSLYAATKKADEMMAHSYSHLFDIPSTGLRLFTVYGPWGRPDMAIFKFTAAIKSGRPVQLFNNGKLKRDFTYVDDVVSAIIALLDHPPQRSLSWDPRQPDPSSSTAPFRLYNIGNSQPEELWYFLQCIEQALGKQAIVELLPMQAGDVEVTWAESSPVAAEIGFSPKISLEVGVKGFVDWYLEHYHPERFE